MDWRSRCGGPWIQTVFIYIPYQLRFTVLNYSGWYWQWLQGPFFPLLPLLQYPGFRPHAEILPKDHKRMPYNLPLPCDILFEQDFCVPMRDGIKLYCDVFRPPNVRKVPIILAWAPYGKHGNSELFLNELPERLGIPKSTYSGYENFEGPDPAYWYVLATNLVWAGVYLNRVPRGYAIVNIDARGSWNSEGNMYYWGNNVRLNHTINDFWPNWILGFMRRLRCHWISCEAALV